MKIKMIPLLAIVVSSLVLSGCLKQTNQVMETEQEQEQTGEQGESFNGSLKEMLGLGKKVECSWQFDDPEGKSSSTGTVWVDGDRSRSEVSVKVEGEEGTDMDMISISDGKMNYMWSRGQKTGSKFDIAEMEKLSQEMKVDQSDNYQNQAQSDWEKMYDYKCKAWRVDESKFLVPTDVEFTNMMEQMETIKQNMAGVCDNLPEPQKSQCQESLQ